MLIAFVLAAILAPGDPDGVVTTAPRGAGAVILDVVAPTSEARPDAARAAQVTPHDLTTQEQIDRWLAARAPDAVAFAGDSGEGDDRRMHGFVSGSIGTDDYFSVSVGVSLPVGETGRLDLSYSQTKNGYGYGHGYGSPGYGYGFPGYDRPGYGDDGRPFGAPDPLYGARTRSGRSVALGFRGGEERDRRARVSAAD